VNEELFLASQETIADREVSIFRNGFAQLLMKVAVNAVQLLTVHAVQ